MRLAGSDDEISWGVALNNSMHSLDEIAGKAEIARQLEIGRTSVRRILA